MASEGTDAEPGFLPVFALLLAATAVPIWIADLLPMVDLPAHLSMVRIHQDLRGDPASRFHSYFMERSELIPYLGFHWVVYALGTLFPLETASRLFVTACVVATPLGALALARAFDRSRWLALFALPFVYTFTFYLGFLNHLAAVALLLFCLALYTARLRGRSSGRIWDVALVAAPLLLFFVHAQPFAFFLCCLGVLLAAFPEHRVATAVRALPSVVLLALWFRGTGTGEGEWTTVSHGFLHRLRALPTHLTDAFRDSTDAALLLLVVALWVLAVGLALRDRDRDAWRADAAAALLAGGAILAYLVVPHIVTRGTFEHLFAYERFAVIGALILAVAVPLRPGRMRKPLAVALALTCAAHSAYVSLGFYRFDRETSGFRALAERIEPSSCVATIFGYFPSSVIRHQWNFSHLGLYFTVWRGAIPGYPAAGWSVSPIAPRRMDGTRAATFAEVGYPYVHPPRIGPLAERGQLLEEFGGFYRYFLLPRFIDPVKVFGEDGAATLARVGEGGPFLLLENPAGTCRSN